jgi:hypothetical protein
LGRTQIEAGEEVMAQLTARGWSVHEDEVLGTVRTRLPASQAEEAAEDESARGAPAIFPPRVESRLPTTTFARPATSLVTRFKMKKRLSDQWERVFGACVVVFILSSMNRPGSNFLL